MDNHPRLRKSKWNEYTDGIKRNQPFRISSENEQKGNGTNCKCQDPIRVSHTCPFSRYMLRHVFIFAILKDNIGKAEKPVLAATARIMAVENWKT